MVCDVLRVSQCADSLVLLRPLQVAEEEQEADHTMVIQDALQQGSVEVGQEHHLVVSSDDMEGIKTVTVYTQGEDSSQFIVYVQTDEQMTEA